MKTCDSHNKISYLTTVLAQTVSATLIHWSRIPSLPRATANKNRAIIKCSLSTLATYIKITICGINNNESKIYRVLATSRPWPTRKTEAHRTHPPALKNIEGVCVVGIKGISLVVNGISLVFVQWQRTASKNVQIRKLIFWKLLVYTAAHFFEHPTSFNRIISTW